MSEKEDQSLDVLGVKPVGEAINTIVKGSVDAASAFLSRICLPACEEFGLLLRDKVSNWRAQNLVKMAEKAEKKLKANSGIEGMHAHPRIAALSIEHSSWADTEELQEMWAGLLASSCTENGRDDSNLIFINLLNQLTTLQVQILNYSCEKAKKKTSHIMGLIYAEELKISVEDLAALTGIKDIHRLDRELDHLKALELMHAGFPLVENQDEMTGDELLENMLLNPEDTSLAVITPSTLGLNLYVRCQGSLLSPVEYFGLSKS